MTEIVEFSFYPDPQRPRWGLLHVFTDGYAENPYGRRGTMRGDPDLVKAFKEAYHDQGPVLASNAPDVAIAGGPWQMAPGWPDDWDYDPMVDDWDAVWSDPFMIDPESGRPAPVEEADDDA